MRWCNLLNHACGEPQRLSQPLFAHSRFLSHMSLDIQHRRSNIQLLLSPLYHLGRSCDDSHTPKVPLHILCYTFGTAGQPRNSKTCPMCRFHPINSSMFQENGEMEGGKVTHKAEVVLWSAKPGRGV